MDGQQYNQMIERLKQKGVDDYTDGDIVAEYAIYIQEQEALKDAELAPPPITLKSEPELKAALKLELDKKKKGGK